MKELASGIRWVICALLMLMPGGCGLTAVTITPGRILEVSEKNAPVVEADGKHEIQFRARLSRKTVSFAYDDLLWRTTQMPYARLPGGDFLLFDTGSPQMLHVTLDIVEREQLPAHLGRPPFAYVREKTFGELEVLDTPADVERVGYDFQVLGVPLYRHRGWVMGLELLRQAQYLCCDNRQKKLTVGFESFVASEDLAWEAYDMTVGDRTKVRLKMQGEEFEMLADSAGGPHLILNEAEWGRLRDKVQVTWRRKDRYPTWGGFQEVEAYTVKELQFGSVKTKDATVWVRQGNTQGAEPAFGLGVFPEAVVVWDFAGRKLRLGQRVSK